MSEQQERNVYYIIHSIELLVWLLITLFITIVFFLLNVRGAFSSNTYTIYMPDVDGLITGSPVRAMGVEIGHVTKIKPINNDEVFVKFVVLDKEIELPQGTVATVEFSGMAGSKSLELYLPDENTYIDSSVPLIAVAPPKRLQDAFGLLNDMFKRIGDMIYTSSDFSNKLRQIGMPKLINNNQDPKEFLRYADGVLDRSEERAENLRRNIENARRKFE